MNQETKKRGPYKKGIRRNTQRSMAALARTIDTMLAIRRRRVSFLFAWYDPWIGAYWDRQKRRLYILPLPCIGIVINLAPTTTKEGDTE